MPDRQLHPRLIIGPALAAAMSLGGMSHAQKDPGNVAAAPPANGSAARYEQHKVIRAHLHTQQQLDTMLGLGGLPLNCVPGVGDVDFVMSPGAMAKFRTTGISAQVTIDDVQPLIDASVNRMREQAAQAGNAGGGALLGEEWFDDYKTYPQVNNYLTALAALRPDLASVITIGTSLENRPIRGLRISSARGPALKPAMLINGCQHAREWIAVMVPMYIADYLVRNYDTDADARAAVDNLEIFIVPIVNVDGYEFTYSLGGNRLWRKNRRDNGNGTIGVDLNRNWGVNWAGPYTASPDSTSDLYYGTAAFSEPETAALRDFVMAHPRIRGHIDVHSYGQLVLQPWTGQYAPPAADCDVIDSLGTAMNTAIFGVHATPYSNGWGGHLLYLASGVLTDWCYGARNILSYAVEVRDRGTAGFLLPPQQILPTCQENIGGILAMAGRLVEGVEYFHPLGLPPIVNAEATTAIPFDVHPQASGPLATNGVTLHWRLGTGGPFTQAGVVELGADHFLATLPAAPCGEILQYYLQAESQAGPMYRNPANAPANVHQAQATDLIVGFDFEGNAGWTTAFNSAFNGHWERGVPVASPDWPYDPLADADGSGQCQVTGNIASAFGNADVDGGSVTLISPTIDMSAIPGSASSANGGGAVITYSYFLHIVSVNNDPMVVEVNADDGVGAWTEISRHTQNTGHHWRRHAITQAQITALNVPLTATMKLRFTVTDGAPESIVEAGIDAVKIVTACDGPPPPPPPCDADITPEGGNDLVDIDDLVLVITSWGATGPNPADITADSIVNIDDLVAVITAWGACP